MKIQLVRNIHINSFYNMDFRLCDPKKELWGNADFSKSGGIQSYVLMSNIKLLRVRLEITRMFEHIRENPAVIPTCFPYTAYAFQRQLNANFCKSIKSVKLSV